jgi:hypothetical protein
MPGMAHVETPSHSAETTSDQITGHRCRFDALYIFNSLNITNLLAAIHRDESVAATVCFPDRTTSPGGVKATPRVRER